MLFVGTTNSQQRRSRSKGDLVGPINSSRGQQRSSFTCLNYDLRGRGTRIEFGFDFSGLCRVRGRGSPRFGAARRPLGSKKSKRPVVSHRWKGGFRAFRASLRIMYTVVGHRPAPRPLGYRRYHD